MLAALWHPVGTAGLTGGMAVVIATGSLIALQPRKVPVWAVVVAGAGVGAVMR